MNRPGPPRQRSATAGQAGMMGRGGMMRGRGGRGRGRGMMRGRGGRGRGNMGRGGGPPGRGGGNPGMRRSHSTSAGSATGVNGGGRRPSASAAPSHARRPSANAGSPPPKAQGGTAGRRRSSKLQRPPMLNATMRQPSLLSIQVDAQPGDSSGDEHENKNDVGGAGTTSAADHRAGQRRGHGVRADRKSIGDGAIGRPTHVAQIFQIFKENRLRRLVQRMLAVDCSAQSFRFQTVKGVTRYEFSFDSVECIWRKTPPASTDGLKPSELKKIQDDTKKIKIDFSESGRKSIVVTFAFENACDKFINLISPFLEVQYSVAGARNSVSNGNGVNAQGVRSNRAATSPMQNIYKAPAPVPNAQTPTDSQGVGYIDYRVRMRKGILGGGGERIMVLSDSTQSIGLMDSSRKYLKEVPLVHVLQCAIPSLKLPKNASPSDVLKAKTRAAQKAELFIVFKGAVAKKMKPWMVSFPNVFDRTHFCERIRNLCGSVAIVDDSTIGDFSQQQGRPSRGSSADSRGRASSTSSGYQSRDSVASNASSTGGGGGGGGGGAPLMEHSRYSVVKLNKFGLKKKRLISVHLDEKIIRSFTPAKTFKDLDITCITKVEKSYTDGCRVDLMFHNRKPGHFIFTGPGQREKFVQEVMSVLDPESVVGRSRGASADNGSGAFQPQPGVGAGGLSALPEEGVSPMQVEIGPVGPPAGGGRPQGRSVSGNGVRDGRVGSADIHLGAIKSLGPRPSTSYEAKGTFNASDQSGRSFSLWVGSFNVGNGKPEPSGGYYDAWIQGGHDMYAVGLQECSSKHKQAWIDVLLATINAKCPQTYAAVATLRMWEINLFVFVRNTWEHLVTAVQDDSVPCGVGDMLGNKGACALSLKIADTSFCFIVCHLAAREERIHQRRGNFMRIVRELKLGHKDFDVLSQFDHVLWFGDLNYRIAGEWKETLAAVCKNEFEKLQPKDQLYQEMQRNNVFFSFQEGPLNFSPTYRWEKKEDVFSNKREQPPSWTDRILYKCLPDDKSMRLQRYSSAPLIFGSDHRPVFAEFRVQLRQFMDMHGMQIQRQSVASSARGSQLGRSGGMLHVEMSFHQIKVIPLPVADHPEEGKEPPPSAVKAVKGELPVHLAMTSPIFENAIYTDPVDFNPVQRLWFFNSKIDLPSFVHDRQYLADRHIFVAFNTGVAKLKKKKTGEAFEGRGHNFGYTCISLRKIVSENNAGKDLILAPIHEHVISDGVVVAQLIGKFAVKLISR